MSSIEKELQAPLFIRRGNQITLSAKGEEFFIYAQRIVSEYKDAMSSLKGEEARITINMQVNTTRHLLLYYLEEFLPKHPLVDIFIDFNYSQEILNSNEKDNLYHFTIGGKNTFHYHNKYKSLFSERYMLAVSRNHRLADKDCVSVKELINEYFIFQATNKNYSKRMMDCCEENGFTPKVRMLCNEDKYLCTLVAAGIGISIVPEYSWNDIIGEDIRLIPIDEMKGMANHHKLFWNDTRFYPKEMIEFRDGLIRYYTTVTQASPSKNRH